MMKNGILGVLLLFSVFQVMAAHLVGGELYYTHIGGNNYQITLKLYRDCNCVNCAAYADPEYISIFRADGTLFDQIGLPLPPVTPINPPIDNPCLVISDVCVESAVYTNTFTVTLPPLAGGYTLVYQRCCRNNSVSNIVLDAGATYTAHVPTSAPFAINSSPRFTNFPPIFICVNAPFFFNHSATDPDGDSLVYSLVAPFDGADATCPDPSPNGVGGNCPTAPPPPPYTPISFQFPFSPTNPLNNPSNGGNLFIDPQTGLLTGTPNQQGQFVVGVQVSEYRNGQLVGETIRDFQFNVVQCNVPFTSIPSNNIDPITGIGTYVQNCSGFSVNFTQNTSNPPPVSVPLLYSWDFGDPSTSLDISNLPNPSYTYTDTGTYLVTLIVQKGTGAVSCSDTAYALVRVYPTFTSDFSVSNGCEDAPLPFQDLSNSTLNSVINSWNWNFGDGTTSVQQNPSHIYSNPGTYTVRLISTDNNGCIDTITRQIEVYNTPEAAFTSTPVCQRDSMFFLYTGDPSAVGFVWDFGNGQTSTVTNPAAVMSVAGAIPVTLQTFGAQGCRDTLTQLVTVLPLPNINTLSDTTVCPYVNIPFYASAANASSFLWEPALYLSSTLVSDPLCSPPPGNELTYFITITDINGCSSKDSFTLSFYPIPVVDAGLDTSICLRPNSSNPTVMLQATGAVSYQWFPATGLSNSGISNPIAAPAVTTLYFVQGTAATGCSVIDSVFVAVLDPSLELILQDDTFVCQNNSLSLNVLDQGASVYNWTPVSGLSNPMIYNPVFSPTDTTLYILTISNYCYTKSDSVLVNVIPAPRLNAIPLDSICSGDSLLLTAEDAVTYSWSPAAGLNDPLIATPVASPTVSTSYIVTGINAYGCSAQDTTRLLVYYPPITDVQPDTAFICFGDSIVLTASGGISYVWQPDPELSALNISQPIARPQDTSTYVVIVTNIHGCSATDSVTIPVQLPVIALAPSPFNACVGVPLQLTASGGLYYLWRPPNGLTNPAIANPIATPDSNINYLLIVSNDCFTDSTNVDVIIHPLPEVYAGEDTLIYGNTSATLNGTTNGISWFWYPGTHLDNPFDLQTIATPPASQYYTLFAISEYGCQNTDSVFVEVNPDIFLLVPTAFSPNADGVNDLFRIVRYFNIRTLQSFSVWNRWGEKVWETQDLNSGWDGTFRGAVQPVGTYIWEIEATSGNGKAVNRSGEMTLIR